MATIPEPGRAAAHVLLDALSGFESGRTEGANTAAMNVALQRLDDIDGAVSATDDGDGLVVDFSNLVGGAAVSLNWLIERLAFERDTDRHAVIADLRDFLDS